MRRTPFEEENAVTVSLARNKPGLVARGEAGRITKSCVCFSSKSGLSAVARCRVVHCLHKSWS